MSSSFRLFALVAAGLMAAPMVIRADDDERISNARTVAKTWLGEIDAGNYEQSYTDSGPALHDKVKQDQWVRILKTERPLLGKVVNRQEINHTYKPDGLEGVQGEFMVIGYRTSFTSNPDELEYVVLRHEFGGWRCVGYDFGPEQTPGSITDNSDAPVTTTTTQTLTPPTPTNGVTVPAKRDH